MKLMLMQVMELDISSHTESEIDLCDISCENAFILSNNNTDEEGYPKCSLALPLIFWP